MFGSAPPKFKDPPPSKRAILSDQYHSDVIYIGHTEVTARVILFKRLRAYTYKSRVAVSLECPNFTLQLRVQRCNVQHSSIDMKANFVYPLALATALVHATPTNVSSLVSSS